MGDAGQQARRVVEELRTALQATAVQSVKTTRSLAKFDEINRLPAPAVQKAGFPAGRFWLNSGRKAGSRLLPT